MLVSINNGAALRRWCTAAYALLSTHGFANVPCFKCLLRRWQNTREWIQNFSLYRSLTLVRLIFIAFIFNHFEQFERIMRG